MEGALIIPSEEDNNTFSINFSTGEVYKIRAAEAKERQVWVDKLRACADRTVNSRKPFVRSVMSPSSQCENFPIPSPAEAFNSVNDILMGLEFKQYEIARALAISYCLNSSPIRISFTELKASAGLGIGKFSH